MGAVHIVCVAPDLGGVPASGRLEQERITYGTTPTQCTVVRPDEPHVGLRPSNVTTYPGSFRIDVRPAGRRAPLIVAAIGELDLATASPLNELLLQSEAAQPECLVLDLSGLSFIDCSGLRAVLDADARARQANRRFQVACVNGQVMRLLALSGADRQLELIQPLPTMA